jgi:hypothetical protein
MSGAARLRWASVLIGCALAFGLAEVSSRLYASLRFTHPRGAPGADLEAGDLTTTSPHGQLGWELRPNLEGVFRGGRFRTNAAGMRDEPHPMEKPAGVYRIVGIGDSVLMGWGVSQGEDFLSRSEALLAVRCRGAPPIEALNFGVLGYNAIQQYFALRDRALDYSPDLVLVSYVGNDQEPTQFEKPAHRVATRSFFVNLVAMWALRAVGWRHDPRDTGVPPADFSEAFRGILELAGARGARVLVVLDSRYEWTPGLRHREVAGLARGLGADAIDLYAIHRDLPPGTPIRRAISIDDAHNRKFLIELGPGRDHHTNAAWHADTAERVAERVVANGWIPGCGR